jgi:hypothetical protein
MPLHALLGHLGIVSAPITSVLVLLYVWRAGYRPALRVPLAVFSVVNFGILLWAEYAGTSLLKSLEAAATANRQTLPETVRLHADLGESLAVVGFVLMVSVLVTASRATAPGRLAAVILGTSAVTTLAVSAMALTLGLEAVWAQHSLY